MRIARVEPFTLFTLKVDCKYHVMNRSLFQKSFKDIAVSSPPVLFDIVASSPLRNNWYCNFGSPCYNRNRSFPTLCQNGIVVFTPLCDSLPEM